MKSFTQILIGLTIFILALYNYLQSLNDLTRLRMQLPQAQQEHLQVKIQYQQLSDELHQQFNLKEMLNKLETPEFCHLRHYQHPKVFAPALNDKISLKTIQVETP